MTCYEWYCQGLSFSLICMYLDPTYKNAIRVSALAQRLTHKAVNTYRIRIEKPHLSDQSSCMLPKPKTAKTLLRDP